MPNVTVFCPESTLARKAEAERFTNRCKSLCIDVLHAEPDKVHIIFVAIGEVYCGRDGFIEIKCRLTAHRTREVMNAFMTQLDALYIEIFSVSPRIRCFGFGAEEIFALH